MKLTVESSINVPRNLAKIRDDTFWLFTASEWHKLYSEFVPRQSGDLMEQVEITPGQIEHTVPYAARQYLFNNNPRTNKNELASKKWDKAAEPTRKPKLIKAMQNYADSGRLKLGG